MEEVFEYLTAADWEALAAHGETAECGKDQILLEEGERRRALYVILEGSCRVEQPHGDRSLVVATLGRHEFFGDMNFLEGVGASATVRADEPTTVLIISPEDVHPLLEADAALEARFYRSLAVNLSRRLRATTSALDKLLQ